MNFTYQPLARGNTVHVWDLVIRALPRKWQPVPNLVNPELAQELFMPELIKLQGLAPDYNHFPASLFAAALLSLRTHPASEDFWSRYIGDFWLHDERGYDSVGALKALVEDCKVTESVSRTPGARYLAFRSALKLSIFAATNQNSWAQYRYDRAPTQCDVIGVLEHARTSLGEVYTCEGFVHPAFLHPHMNEIRAPEIRYSTDINQAMKMVHSDSLQNQVSGADLHSAYQWLALQPLPPHLTSPPALAAAIQTTAQNEQWRTVWEDIFNGRWRRATSGRSNLAGRIHSALKRFNCIKRDPASAVQLYRSCQSALAMQKRQEQLPDGWSNRPWGREDADLKTCWEDLEVDFEPTVIFEGTRPCLAGSPTKPRTKPEIRTFTTVHETGRKAEEHFLSRYRDLLNDPNAEIFDHRDKGRGYDFLVRRKINGVTADELYEIKGDLYKAVSCRLTDRQWQAACAHRTTYNLVLIESLATGAIQEHILNDPAAFLSPTRKVAKKPSVSWHVDISELQAAIHCKSATPLETTYEG